MEKKKLQMAVTMGLIVVFFVVFSNGIKTAAKRKQAAAAPKPNVPAALAAPSAVKPGLLPAAVGQLMDSQKPQGRDPFRRGGNIYSSGDDRATRRDEPHLSLTGVLYDKAEPDKSYAIINNQMLKAGERFDSYLVTDIQIDYIMVKDEKEGKDRKICVWNEI